MQLDIEIPYDWKPRHYQATLWNALKSGKKRAVYVWHRRAGKDLFGLNWLISRAILDVPGTYWHVFPTYNQGKKAIWNESDIKGRKYLDYFPQELIESKNDQEMRLKLRNGSVYQIVGSDNVDALRGAGIKGAIFSEYAEQRPSAWEIIQPMIMATNGWAIFNFTPKGQNHAYDLYNMAKDNPKWHAEILTAQDTMPDVFTQEQLEDIKKESLDRGKTLDLFNQEYYCSFNNAIEGAYYSQQILQAEKENRITNVAYEANHLVDTWWDLGVSDSTTIWFTQTIGSEIRIIDYYENSGQALQHYIQVVKEKPYLYNKHNGPHDLRVRELGTGKSRLETAYTLGLSFDVVANIPVQDGINAVRSIFNKCWFDKTKCKKGLMAIRNYKRVFDELKNDFKDKPYHDWSSHAADAFRYLAVGISDAKLANNNKQSAYAEFNFNY